MNLESLKQFLKRQETKVKSQKLWEISTFIQGKLQNPSILEKIVLPKVQEKISEGLTSEAVEILRELGKIDGDYLTISKKAEELPSEETSGIEDYIKGVATALERDLRLSDRIAEEVLKELQQVPEISRENIQKVVNEKVEELKSKLQEACVPYFPFKMKNMKLMNLLKTSQGVKELSIVLGVEKNNVKEDLDFLVRFNLVEELRDENKREYKLTPKGAAYIVETNMRPHVAKRIIEACENGIERSELETTLVATGIKPNEVREAIQKGLEIGLINYNKEECSIGPLGELYKQSY